MPTDRDILKKTQAGLLNATGMSDPVGEVAKVNRRIIQFSVTDGGTAGTAFTETANYMPHACKVVAAYVTTPIAVTANGTNYATITLAKRTAGGSSTTVGTRATSSTGFTAFAPSAMTLTASAVELAAADSLTIAVAKAASGVALAAATSNVLVTVIVEEI